MTPNFTGVFVPKELYEMWIDGALSSDELLLCVVVDSLCGERDCYASNDWLAEKMRLSERTVSRMVGKLTEMGLLRQTAFNGRVRELRPAYRPRAIVKEPAPAPAPAPAPVKLAPLSRERKTSNKYTERLRKLLISKGKLMNDSTAGWDSIFAKLEASVGKDRLEAALLWYEQHIGEPYVPAAYAAGSFAKKFPQIEDAIKRSAQAPKAVQVPPMDVGSLSPDAKAVFDAVAGLGWKDEATLAAAIQASAAGYEELAANTNAMLATASEDVRRYDAEIWKDMGGLRVFLTRWFRQVHTKVSSWEAWNGSFSPYIIRWDCAAWRHYIRSVLGRYTGSGTAAEVYESHYMASIK